MALRRAAPKGTLAAVAGGDDDAFAGFYREHLDAVVAFFWRRVPSPELAFDLAAETFAAFIVSARSAPRDAEAVAWLYGIANNKLRESARRGRVDAAARERLGLQPVELTDHDVEQVEECASAGALQLDERLAALPHDMRAAVVARVVDERSYSDIAQELQCSEQVIRQRVHRGLAHLRATLREDQ